MKKLHKLFSYLMIFGIVTFGSILFTKDIKEAQAASIYLNDKSITLENDHYKTLRIKGTSQKATWLSTNSKVAVVSSSGRVTARASGTTTIVAKVAGKKLTCTVRVVQISKKEFSLAPGQEKSLIVWGANNTLTWRTNDPSIATVTDSGTITAKALGTTTIYATVNGKDISCKVTVVKMNHDSIVLEYGGKFGFIKTLKVDNTSKKITWSSSDNSIATVNSKGEVIARGAGTATITASVDGAMTTCEVKILQMSEQYLTLKKGETKTLKILGTDNKVIWSSYKKSVATVSSDGTVTPQAAGSAKIVGEVDGILVRAYVTVIE